MPALLERKRGATLIEKLQNVKWNLCKSFRSIRSSSQQENIMKQRFKDVFITFLWTSRRLSLWCRRYERIILVAKAWAGKVAAKQWLALFLTSSKMRKLNSTTECFLLCCQWVLWVDILKVKILQKLTDFVVLHFF